jgi:hypothetical protein
MFPFQRVVESLRSSHALQDMPGGVRWLDHDGHTDLTMRLVDHVSPDGLHVDEEVTVTHYSPVFSDFSEEQACTMNRLATGAALMPASEEQPGRFVTVVRVIRGDVQAAEYAYGPLTFVLASMVGQQAALLARGMFEWDPERSVVHGPNHPCALPREDFESLVPHLQMKHLAYEVDPAGREITAEFPWDAGAYSAACRRPEFAARLREDGLTDEDIAMMAGRTSLLTITQEEPHPLFGHGLRYRLELPLETGASGPVWAAALNRLELQRADMPPLFGAWCEGPRGLMFHGFVPNQGVMRGLPQFMLGWLLVRHQIVREALLRVEQTPPASEGE